MIAAGLAILLTVPSYPPILETLESEDVAAAGLVADVLERPAGMADADFAQWLIDTEGLHPSNGTAIGSDERDLSYKAIWANDGRNAVVYYLRAQDARVPGRICRIRANDGRWTSARWQAIRWCRAAFGLSTPASPPPPIVSAPAN